MLSDDNINWPVMWWTVCLAGTSSIILTLWVRIALVIAVGSECLTSHGNTLTQAQPTLLC